MEPNKRLWFKRRRYGYGWTPVTWQGWVSIIVFLAIVILGMLPLLANPYSTALLWLYLTTVITSVVILVAISASRGPRPKWRWGKKPDDDEDDW